LEIGGGQILVAIAIEVAYRDGLRTDSHSKVLGGLEGAIAPPEEDGYGVGDIGAEIRRSQILVAIAIEVAYRDGKRIRASDRNVWGSLEGAIAPP
jgi:hypothetical protein